MRKNSFYYKLLFLLDVSSKLYVLYIKSGKKYIYAKSLYKNNNQIYNFIINNLAYVDDALIDEFKSLNVHYLNWFTQFELLENSIPSLKEDTVFAFSRDELDYSFPKDLLFKIEKILYNK